MTPYRQLLVTTDFSEPASAGVQHAARLAQATGAKVHLLYVAEDRLPPLIDEKTRHMVLDQHRQIAGERLTGYASELLGGCSYEIGVEVGRPAHVIAEQAEKLDADLIVMGSHGHTALGRAILGSTTDRVLRETSRPVLVVRRPPPTN